MSLADLDPVIPAGYVSMTKSRGRGSVTTYRITRRGFAAFRKHAAAPFGRSSVSRWTRAEPSG